MKKLKVAPSILSADFSALQQEVDEVREAEYLHLDIMDGHFVPNISFGTVAYQNLAKGNMIFDAHLMITDPLFYAPRFIEAGADIITFHYEAVSNPKEVIAKLKEYNVMVGMAIKPETNVNVFDKYFQDLDLALIMSVEPGFSGQKFIPSALDKIKYLNNQKQKNNYKYLIEVDGGINYETATECYKCGCDIVVAGNYIFKSEDKREKIMLLHNIK